MHDDHAAFLERNASEFILARGISLARLQTLVQKQFPDAAPILLTSSAVQGLATPSSDIDMICLTGAPQPGNRMATQIHDAGHHLETVAFEAREVTGAFAALSELSGLDAGGTVAGLARWDKERPVSRKYLERIINGVDMELKVPYARLQPALGHVWATAAYDAFRQSSACMVLAMRAGEHRAAAGYAANALLFLMDAAFSATGRVYSNKKWTLRRWRMAEHRIVLAHLGAWTEEIDALWTAVRGSLGGPLAPTLADQVLALLPRAGKALGFTRAAGAAPGAASRLRFKPFLPGSIFAVAPSGSAVLLRDAPDPSWNGAEPEALAGLSPTHARTALQAARAGIINLSLAVTAQQAAPTLLEAGE